jgi:hypothetical protein
VIFFRHTKGDALRLVLAGPLLYGIHESAA